MPEPTVRIARPSRDLQAAERFYVDGVGLQVLGRAAADGPQAPCDLVILGRPDAAWHLELTRRPIDPALPSPTAEDLLVLYLGEPVPPERLEALQTAGGRRVPADNPYWERWGVTVADPDGYRLVLCSRSWS